MDAARFDALVVRLESLAARRPTTYVALTIGVAALGFLILGLVVCLTLSTALLVGAVVFLIATKSHAAILVVYAGKLLILLLLPAFAMVRASFTLMLARFPEPQGRELKPAEAPQLFAALHQLRRRMKGPAVHKVLLNDELNASIVQHPRLGLFGWEKNILILGMPLLQVLNTAEALSVLAHEYGHLSGHHSRLGGFIYRFRSTWGQLHALSRQWKDWGSRLIARLFQAYAPYFNAYTFVLARKNEYLADRTAVEVAGRRNAASALMRIRIAGLFEAEEFWPTINRQVADEAEPLASRSERWQQSVQAAFEEAPRRAFLTQALQRKTDRFDTHPALTDRLAAMGVATNEEALAELQPVEATAAKEWLGTNLDAVRAELDHTWRESVADNWHSRHAHLRERRERLDQLASLPTPNPAERWEQVQILEEVQTEVDVLADINAILEIEPNHLAARFRRGTLLLDRGDGSGIADLEAVMAVDCDAILPGCNAAWRYCNTRDEGLAKQYMGRWQDRAAAIERIQTESSTLSEDAILAPADLDPGTVAKITAILRNHGQGVSRAYLMRRTLDVKFGDFDYVLAFETDRFMRARRAAKILQRIAAQPFPISLMIFHLSRESHFGFRNRFARLGIEPLPRE